MTDRPYSSSRVARETLKEVVEIEHHLHNWDSWLGQVAVPDAANSGDVDSLAPFVLTSGNDDYGSWLQILGTADTPIRVGKTFYDPHRILIAAASSTANVITKIQLACGTSGAAGLAALTYSELPYVKATNSLAQVPVETRFNRVSVGTPLWARFWAAGENAKTISILVGVHEYDL